MVKTAFLRHFVCKVFAKGPGAVRSAPETAAMREAPAMLLEGTGPRPAREGLEAELAELEGQWADLPAAAGSAGWFRQESESWERILKNREGWNL